ncbi:MAG: SDR family NAD(P)-dependent oxidoreductase [Stackebrandtia sp.]
MKAIRGKTAVVTGGAQGIGRATVDRLVDEGARVVVADIAADEGEAALRERTARGGEVMFTPVDVADEQAVAAMVAAGDRRFGGVDFLVNCAAAFIMKGVEATVDEWRRVMDVNVMGQALCVKHVVPHMIRGGGGAVVNIASISGHIAQPKYLTYNTAKGAVVNMTRCMAMDLAEYGIRVNAVNPGTTWNANNERYHREELGLSREQAEKHPDIGGRHMLGRTADPEEIASAVVFLLSGDAGFITGENLMVDGGYTAM